MFRLGYPDQGNNVPGFTLGNGTTQVSVATGVPLIKDQWTHVAAVYDGSDVILYVDGVFAVSTPDPGTVVPTPANTSELHLGSDYGTEVFTGNIDEARVYNRPLDAVEIGILKNGQQPPTLPGASPMPGGNHITWTAPAIPATGLTYSLLYGPSTGNYTGVINNISTTSYDDLAAPQGVATYYAVV